MLPALNFAPINHAINPILARLLASLTPEQAAAVVAEANRLYDAGRPNRKENTQTDNQKSP